MNGQEIKEMQVKYNLQSWSKQKGINPIPIEKADGIYMWDFDGNRYSDMSSQLVNLNVGHNCRPIIEAIKEQAEKYCYLSPSYGSEPRAKLAKMVVDLMPDNMGGIFHQRRRGRKRKCGKDRENVHGAQQDLLTLQKLSWLNIRRRQPHGRTQTLSA